jgi:hypothetical protein
MCDVNVGGDGEVTSLYFIRRWEKKKGRGRGKRKGKEKRKRKK